VHRLDVRHRIDAPVDMRHVVIAETPHQVQDGVYFPDVSEKLVAEPFSLRCAAYEACDVHEANRSRYGPLGLEARREGLEPRIRDRDDAHVGLDGTEGEILSFGVGGSQRIEKSALADVRQPNDATSESHAAFGSSVVKRRRPGPTRRRRCHNGKAQATHRTGWLLPCPGDPSRGATSPHNG
jgi:hypothetical protein